VGRKTAKIGGLYVFFSQHRPVIDGEYRRSVRINGDAASLNVALLAVHDYLGEG